MRVQAPYHGGSAQKPRVIAAGLVRAIVNLSPAQSCVEPAFEALLRHMPADLNNATRNRYPKPLN